LPLGALVAHSSSTSLLAAGFVSLALVAGMAEYFQRLAFANFANRTVNDARSAANARVSRLDTEAKADLTAQVLADSARVKQGLKGVLNHIVLNALLVVGACRSELALRDVQELHHLDAASARADIDTTRLEGRCTCAANVVLAVAGRLTTGLLFTVVGYLLVLHGPGVRLARQTARIGGVRVSAEHLGRVLVPTCRRVGPARRLAR
jgi:hypothetical protein